MSQICPTPGTASLLPPLCPHCCGTVLGRRTQEGVRGKLHIFPSAERSFGGQGEGRGGKWDIQKGGRGGQGAGTLLLPNRRLAAEAKPELLIATRAPRGHRASRCHVPTSLWGQPCPGQGAQCLRPHPAQSHSMSHRLDQSSRSPEPRARLWHGKGGCAAGRQAGRRGGDRILTLLFSPAKIIPVAYKKKGQRQ